MGLIGRIMRLEDDMFQRKIDEKLEEYSKKYKRKFEVKGNCFNDCFLEINGERIGWLTYDAFFKSKEKVYNNLCEFEDAIKIYLFDEMWGKENAQVD